MTPWTAPKTGGYRGRSTREQLAARPPLPPKELRQPATKETPAPLPSTQPTITVEPTWCPFRWVVQTSDPRGCEGTWVTSYAYFAHLGTRAGAIRKAARRLTRAQDRRDRTLTVTLEDA